MNTVSLSLEAQTLLTQIEADGRLPTTVSIFRAPLPPKRWWTAISQGARGDEPVLNAAKRIAAALEEDSNLPIWPLAMYETADSLPRVSSSEGIALFDRFLRLEADSLVVGTLLYKLQWDVLAAHYCPLRERYQVLECLVQNGVLLETEAESPDQRSGLRWPLTIGNLLPLIREGRLRGRLPTFSRLEDFIAATQRAYPNLLKIFLWMTVGGGLLLFGHTT